MAFDFPNSPTVGQQYTDATSGITFEWDGDVWFIVPGTTLGTIATQDADAVDITGGTINGVDIGLINPNDAEFLDVIANSLSVTGTLVFGTLSDGVNTAPSIQSSLVDATLNALLKTGAFGIGHSQAHGNLTAADSNDLDAIRTMGFWRFNTGAVGSPPIGGAGVVLHGNRLGSDGVGTAFQLAFMATSLDYLYYRNYQSGWAPWRILYTSASLLGTVSQSGGVPTGAVIERGSNANGEYVRFADGTQICHNSSFVLKAAADATTGVKSSVWTFPAEFSTATHLSVIGVLFTSGAASRRSLCSTGGNTAANLYYEEVAGTSADVLGRLMAIGRWF